PMERYNGVPIFYSMGNFCYGGHLNPDDKDSVIVSVTLSWEDGAAVLQEVKPLPCCISSTVNRNDYCPTLYEEGGAGYQRVMEKLRWSE
ncbi:MAG: CapA family protein, partial [Clostridiales bacterium]|nr:CapA family protein [Candidatus Apopatocola equi]